MRFPVEDSKKPPIRNSVHTIAGMRDDDRPYTIDTAPFRVHNPQTRVQLLRSDANYDQGVGEVVGKLLSWNGGTIFQFGSRLIESPFNCRFAPAFDAKQPRLIENIRAWLCKRFFGI